MSFVDGYYNIQVNISNTVTNAYERLRLKIVKHPAESLVELSSRLFALLHAYRPGLEFSEGLFSPDDPAAWKKDVTGEILLWLETGTPALKKLKRARRLTEGGEVLIYFRDDSEAEAFCTHLKGSKDNWVREFRFFLFDPIFLKQMSELLDLKMKIDLTVLEEALFLNVNGLDLQTAIPEIDIWRIYQRVIANPTKEKELAEE